ncbi:hypothetical protein TNCV_1973111 [Trichonephila clavipes]|nr:hypothetical protein TNCV_1973111 [Trichonephila clavipes]
MGGGLSLDRFNVHRPLHTVQSGREMCSQVSVGATERTPPCSCTRPTGVEMRQRRTVELNTIPKEAF